MKGDIFVLLTPTGTDLVWDGGDEWMLEKLSLSNRILGAGGRGRISKKMTSYYLLNDSRWDIRPATHEERVKIQRILA